MHEIVSHAVEAADIRSVRRIEGAEEIRSRFPVYLTDESKFSAGGAEHLFFPANEAELAAVVAETIGRGAPLTVSGARTGLVGGCAPQGGAVVAMERFDRVRDIYYDSCAREWRITAQCNVSLRDLNEKITQRHFPEIEREGSPGARERAEAFRREPQPYFYPPDPTELSASLGGTVATNASGARTYRYGPTRNWVRRIRVMLANGETLDIPRGRVFASPSGEFLICGSKGARTTIRLPDYPVPRTKFTAGLFTAPGMDLIDLFIGAEGILGIITEVDVALKEREEKISVVQFLDSDRKALDFVCALRAESRLRPDFIEFYACRALDFLRDRQHADPRAVGMPPLPGPGTAAIFYDLSFDPRDRNADFSAVQEVAAACGATVEKSWAGYEARELGRFKAFRHVLPETINAIISERKKRIPQLHKLNTDLAVPDDRLYEIWEIYENALDSAGLEWVGFGHIGNNHIHINVLPRSMEEMERALSLYTGFAEKAVAFGGSVSAEHGVGKMKKKFLHLMYSADRMEQIRRVKRALDPKWLLNVGNMVDP